MPACQKASFPQVESYGVPSLQHMRACSGRSLAISWPMMQHKIPIVTLCQGLLRRCWHVHVEWGQPGAWPQLEYLSVAQTGCLDFQWSSSVWRSPCSIMSRLPGALMSTYAHDPSPDRCFLWKSSGCHASRRLSISHVIVV